MNSDRPIREIRGTRMETRGALDANDRIIYIRSTGELMFDRNGSAADGRVLIATLPRNLTMVASEVVIIP